MFMVCASRISGHGEGVIAGRDWQYNQQNYSIVVERPIQRELSTTNYSTRKNEIRQQAAGGYAQPILIKKHFSQLGIAIPPATSRQAIAAVLEGVVTTSRVEPADERDVEADWRVARSELCS